MGTDPVGALAVDASSAESIRLTALSTECPFYYGACVDNVSGESADNNCSRAATVTVAEGRPRGW